MEDFDWLGKDEEKVEERETTNEKKDEEEIRGEKEELNENETGVEESAVEVPPGVLAVLTLVDIAPEVKRLRDIPQFFHLKEPITSLGTGRGMQVKVLDLKTVRTKHAVIVFRHGQFHVFPQEGAIRVNGEWVSPAGEILKNGSEIEAGSARFVFLTNLEKDEKR